MQFKEILLTLAEVSVAFVGFGGVVGVFGTSRGREAMPLIAAESEILAR